jgi:alkanesulfonate monooxygenase SsuD/methylene tetrahydromethanopterin reductase-like flavin-dependent oxidoreductase (luciferase family)
MGDERTHGDYVVPRLQEAARRAGRPPPRVIAGLPVAVCDDIGEGRRRAEAIYGSYGKIPAYARMLARGEAKTPGEVALVGNEQHIASRLQAYESAGVSDLCAMVFTVGPDGHERTEQLLASLAASR